MCWNRTGADRNVGASRTGRKLAALVPPPQRDGLRAGGEPVEKCASKAASTPDPLHLLPARKIAHRAPGRLGAERADFRQWPDRGSAEISRPGPNKREFFENRMSHRGKTCEPGLFHNHAPARDRCCICDRPGEDLEVQMRPTGPAFSPQPWPYCPSCWQECQTLTLPDPVGYTALIYAVFEIDPRRTRPGMGPIEGADDAADSR